MALQYFHLGYLFKKYAVELSDPEAQQTYQAVCLDMSEVKFRIEARENFKKAF